MDKRGRAAMRYAARSPEVFAAGLATALNACKPFERRAIGPDARMLMLANRLLPPSALHHMIRLMMGIPRHGVESSNQLLADRSQVNAGSDQRREDLRFRHQ
jgi:hypothetical protein